MLALLHTDELGMDWAVAEVWVTERRDYDRPEKISYYFNRSTSEDEYHQRSASEVTSA